MAIPKAVAASVKTPGFFLTVNLLGAPANPGAAALRSIIISPRSTTGDLTVDTEVRALFGPDDAGVAFGVGTPGHLAAKRLFAHYGLASVDALAPTASAGAAATITHVAAGTPTENSTVRFDVHGRPIDVAWNSGEVVATFRARALITINGLADDIFVTASAGVGAGDIDLDAKIGGPWGNDVTTGAVFTAGGAGATITPGGTSLAGGATEPVFTTALTAITTTQYRRIVACLSNADAADATSSSNADRIATHIDTFETGLNALLQVGVTAHTGAVATVQVGAIGRNNEAYEYPFGLNFQSLPSELAGAEAGDAVRFATLRPNFNRINNKLLGLFGPKDPVADKPTPTELEALLNNGVSPLDLEQGTNEIFLVRPITTHSTANSNPDFRAFDLPDTDGIYSVADDLRIFLPQEFANASISPNLPAGGDPLPPGVVELRDVEAATVSRLRTWTRLGVVNRSALEASLANAELIFEIDPADATQVNIFLPLAIIKPLAKLGMVAAKVA